MPYVKDGIGITPRYVYAETVRSFTRKPCYRIAYEFKRLGIPFEKKLTREGCTIQFGDSYEAYADSLNNEKPFFGAFPFLT